AQSSFGRNAGEAVDLVEVARRERAERASSAIHIELPDAPVVVTGERAALARIVGNLIDNALKYGREATVSVSGNAQAAEVIVDDRGPGVPAGERERIFEPFLRLDPSRNRERGGAGLGLAIARHLVQSHGGTIAVEDRPGGGARFRVRLPVAGGTRLA